MAMTGTQIITEARTNFGERTALTLSDAEFQEWLNTALLEVYSLLPLGELEVLAQRDTVTLTDGNGPLPATLDHLLSVEVDDAPAVAMSPVSIPVIDSNPFFQPNTPVWASDGDVLYVRARTLPTTATVVSVHPPARISDFSLPVVLPKWHDALVLMVTALAYAQEEDIGQAQHYRNTALSLINRTFTASEQEALS